LALIFNNILFGKNFDEKRNKTIKI